MREDRTKRDELSPGNRRLRMGIAILGALLPPVLVGFGLWLDGCFPPTMSDFYHLPPASSFFIGILWANGVFLILYQGYSTLPPAYRALPRGIRRWMTDATLSTTAGVAMIVTAVVPTCRVDSCGTEGCGGAFFAGLHLVAAFLCLGTLGVISAFTFTAGPVRNGHDRRKHRIHRLCAGLIWGSLAVIGLLKAFGPAEIGAAVFWLEAVAIWAFAASWLRKAMPDPGEAPGPAAGRA